MNHKDNRGHFVRNFAGDRTTKGERAVKAYTVHIQAIEFYTIEVQAKDKEDAEEKAWRLFPHYSANYGENNVTDIEEHKDGE